MSESTPDSDLKQLKLSFINAAQQIDKMQEPKQELGELAQAMYLAAQTDRAGKEPGFATFLYEDLAPGLAKRLHKERSSDNNVSPNLVLSV